MMGSDVVAKEMRGPPSNDAPGHRHCFDDVFSALCRKSYPELQPFQGWAAFGNVNDGVAGNGQLSRPFPDNRYPFTAASPGRTIERRWRSTPASRTSLSNPQFGAHARL